MTGPKKKAMELELKVGAFVASGLALIMASILLLGGADSFFTRYVRYVVHYPSVEGLIPGAKVQLGGVTVGGVKTVDFDPATRDIKIEITVASGYTEWVRADTQAEIATQGVLGDKFIALTAGSPEAEPLPPGGRITSRAGKDFTQFLGKGDQLMVTLNKIASSLDRILGQFESGNRSETFFSGMASTARNLSQATDKLNKELDQLRLRAAITKLDAILGKINDGTGTIGALVNDPQLYYDARALLGGANRNRVVRNLVRSTVLEADEKKGEEEKKK